MKRPTSLWSKLDPSFQVTEEVTHHIDGRRVVSSVELMEQWGISVMTLRRYSHLGMPKHPCSGKDFFVFDLLSAAEWRNANITNRGVKPQVAREDIPTEDDQPSGEMGATVRKIIADADRAVEQALSEKLKRRQLEGSLIEADTLDIAQAEMAVVYNSNYQNDKRTLPSQLLGKSSGEMRDYLDRHYSNRMEDLHLLVEKQFPECPDTLYDVISVVINQLKNGVPPDVLVFSLGGE